MNPLPYSTKTMQMIRNNCHNEIFQGQSVKSIEKHFAGNFVQRKYIDREDKLISYICK